MRHFYKSHGKHCYLRSFQTSCRKCGADVLYWECTHGSKIFFDYPPYGKLRRHYCRNLDGISHKRKIFPVVVKKPKGLLEKAKLRKQKLASEKTEEKKISKSFKNRLFL